MKWREDGQPFGKAGVGCRGRATRWWSSGGFARLTPSSVESRKGAVARCSALRFPSPLIKPDVRISRIRLSDWLHRKAHGGDILRTRRSRSTPSSP